MFSPNAKRVEAATTDEVRTNDFSVGTRRAASSISSVYLREFATTVSMSGEKEKSVTVCTIPSTSAQEAVSA